MLPFLIFIVFNFAFGDDFNPTVEVPGGSLEGIWEETIKGRTFASFERVPYAEPPVGGLRFEPPRPVKPWKGVWDATGPVENCLQYDPVVQQIMGAEDCLFVNIYSPSLKENANLPVMVFIHGGAFMYGSGSVYDPTFIMDWDMVVVTFNYRVGPLGFLSTGDKAAPGNIGLKDQAFALHWIKKNIKVFGGNPDSITLTGSSAGGASVHYHLLSPLSKGTFHRAMSLSGSAFLPWSFASTPAKYAKKLAMRVGCPTANSEEMVKCLRTVDGNALINVTTTMFEWKVQLFTKFLPTVEPSDVEGAFLTKHPYEASIIGDFYDVPLVITHTSEEGLYPAAVYQKAPSLLPAIEEQWDDIAPDMFHYRDTLAPEKMKAVAHKIKQFYLNGEPVGQDTYPQLVKALSDRNFIVGITKLAEVFARTCNQPVYMYRYAWRGEKSFSDFLSWDKTNYGVSHGDDLFHIFRVPLASSRADEDMKMTNLLIDIIYSFASTGKPKVISSNRQGPEWLPATPEELKYIEISSPSVFAMKSTPDLGHRSFWDSLGFAEDENYKQIDNYYL